MFAFDDDYIVVGVRVDAAVTAGFVTVCLVVAADDADVHALSHVDAQY